MSKAVIMRISRCRNARTVEANGGRVELIEFVSGYSTTILINRIRKLP